VSATRGVYESHSGVLSWVGLCRVIVWHDESIDGTKCKDTKPVKQGDPLFPYVGKVCVPRCL
jgi:hypothetical protein